MELGGKCGYSDHCNACNGCDRPAVGMGGVLALPWVAGSRIE